MKTPSSFIVYCREEESDWSLASCDMAFEVVIQSVANAVIEDKGRRLLSGWGKTASQKVTFHVSRPKNEEAAKRAIVSAIHEIGKTRNLLSETEDYLRPLIVGIPVGCKMMKAPRPVNRKRSKNTDLVSEWVFQIRMAWKDQVESLRKEIAA